MRTIRTKEKSKRFLAVLSGTGNVTRACRSAKISRVAAYEWRAEDQDFRAKWEAAYKVGIEAWEDEVTRRATEGTDKPVFYKGRRIHTQREFSDTLLIFKMNGAKPEKYRQNRVQLTGADGGPIQVTDTTPLEVARRLAFMLQQGVAAKPTIEGTVAEDDDHKGAC